ncbi:MAG: divergent polysaccharide deacetylase family protein [Pseudodonghicola sp.]
MRGFFGGLGLGAAVVVAVAAVMSLLTPLPRPDVGAEAPAAATGGAGVSAAAGVDTTGADADLVEAMPKAPATGPARDDLGPLEGADTRPADKPQVGSATGGLSGPAATATAPDIAPERPAGADTADLPKLPGSGPQAPAAEPGVSIATEPAQPAAPVVAETGSGFGTGAPVEPAAPEAAAGTEATVVSPVEPEAEEEAAPATETEPAPAPRIAALPQAGTDETPPTATPGIGTPVRPLTERDAPATAAAPEGPRPLDRFAASFDNPEGRPLMSIVLIDDASAIGVEALADFPYPLTFAIDPAAPDAAAKMARHRAAGFEVVLLADLPAAATAQDAEVALSVWRRTVPEAVAILEGTGSGFQGNRALSDQVTAIAQSTGLGLITRSNGLNTVQKLAARDGVPSAVVFRDFDGAGQTPTVMRRFLDQAAFRAGQEGAVIMLGRVRPDTVSALLLWGLQDRAERVALAPVSAVLTEKPAVPQ